jgi:hypothetical protein
MQPYPRTGQYSLAGRQVSERLDRTLLHLSAGEALGLRQSLSKHSRISFPPASASVQ